MISDYEIILIVITVIGFILSIAFYVFFVYVPAARAATELTGILQQGSEVITLVEDRIETVKETTAATLAAVCQKLCSTTCLYNAGIGGPCPFTQKAVPAYCDPAIYNVDSTKPNFCTCGM